MWHVWNDIMIKENYEHKSVMSQILWKVTGTQHKAMVNQQVTKT